MQTQINHYREVNDMKHGTTTDKMKKIPKDKLNGLPPLHPNIPSYLNKLNKKSTINIQGIAFPPQKKKIK
jgi:hypothetical protein